MDGMVGQHRNEQVRTDTGVRAMPDWAQAELGLQLPEGVFKVSQSPVRAENLFCIPIGVAGSEHTGPGSSIRQLGLVLPLEANRRGSITGSLNPDLILAGDARVTFFQSPDLLQYSIMAFHPSRQGKTIMQILQFGLQFAPPPRKD